MTLRDWTTVLLHILPLALGAAVSPALLGASLELLARFERRGVRMLLLYLLGSALVVASVVAISLALPQKPAAGGSSIVSDIVDIALAALLLVIAGVLIFRRPATAGASAKPAPKAHPQSKWAGVGVLGLGVFMMVTNFSTLVLLLAGSHEVTSASVDPVIRGLGYGLLAVGALAPILLPLVWMLVSPAAATRDLGRINDAITRHGRVIGIVVSLATAAYLLARGFGLV